jgi:excisionase family DNA binding protein
MDEQKTSEKQRQFFSVRETAERLSVSPITIYRAVEGGRIPCARVGTRRLVPASWLEALESEALAVVSQPAIGEES